MKDVYIKALKELADQYLVCKLDTKPEGKYPEDIKEGGYRWAVYIYSCLDMGRVGSFDREMFIDITKKFRSEHLIFWTRGNLKELEVSGLDDLRTRVLGKMQVTENFNTLRVLIYLDRILKNELYCVDDYMIQVCPWLETYVVGNSGQQIGINGCEGEKEKSQFIFDEKFDFWSSDHRNNLEFIKDFFKDRSNIDILEVGVFEGRTAIWFMDNLLKGKNGRYVGIEPDILPNLRHNLKQYENISMIIDDYSFYALPELICNRNYFELIYVDGDHNAMCYLEDIVMCWRLLEIGGIMLLDDYEMEAKDPYFYVSHKEFVNYPRVNFTHPKTAIDSFLNIYRGLYEIVINNAQIGVKKICDLGEKNFDKNDMENLESFSYRDKR